MGHHEPSPTLDESQGVDRGGWASVDAGYLRLEFNVQVLSGLKVLFTTGYARNAIMHQGRLDPGVELIVKPSFVIDLDQ